MIKSEYLSDTKRRLDEFKAQAAKLNGMIRNAAADIPKDLERRREALRTDKTMDMNGEKFAELEAVNHLDYADRSMGCAADRIHKILCDIEILERHIERARLEIADVEAFDAKKAGKGEQP